MPNFAYQAVDVAGRAERGEATAVSVGALTQTLEERGLLVPAVRPPSVPEGTARLRISLAAGHTEEDIDRLTSELAQCGLRQRGQGRPARR